MTEREFEEAEYEIKVEPHREERLKVTITRGRYATAFDVSIDEAESLIEVLRDALTDPETRRHTR
jgi:hypothetical protein